MLFFFVPGYQFFFFFFFGGGGGYSSILIFVYTVLPLSRGVDQDQTGNNTDENSQVCT